MARRARFADDAKGSILIMTAIGLTMLLGITALAVDAAFWYDRRNQMGAAADSAAWAAAQELKLNSTADLQTYANYEVVMHGFSVGDGTGGTVSVTVSPPDGSSAFSGKTFADGFVQVKVSQTISTFFAAVLGTNTVSIANQAVAGPTSDITGCVYALNSTGADSYWSGDEFDVNGGSATVTATNCGIISNGGFNVDSGSSVTASGFSVHAATMTGGGTATPTPQFSQPEIADPLASMNEPSLFGSAPWTCSYPAPTITSGTYTSTNGNFNCRGCTATLQPGTYCGGWDSLTNPGGQGTRAIDVDSMGTAANITFSPGVYIIDGGGMWLQHTASTGTGVTFYFTSDSTHGYEPCPSGGMANVEVNIDPNAGNTLNLSAPTSGPLAGLLMIRDRTSTQCTDHAPEIEIQPLTGNLTGVIYFPYDHVQYCMSNPQTSSYTVVIGGTIEVQGGTMDDCTGNSYFNAQTGFSAAGYSQSPIKHTATAE